MGAPGHTEGLRQNMKQELLEERKKRMAELLADPAYVPMKLKELAILLGIPKEQRDELKEVMDALVAEGKAGISKKGKYGRPESFSLTGVFSGTSKGFGFVAIEGWAEDVFIPPDKTGGALNGDTVRIVTENGK